MKSYLIRAKNFVLQGDWALYFFYAFVFSTPFWRRLEIETDFSYLMDVKYVDYLTYSLYYFEIFFLVAFIWWLGQMFLLKKRIVLGDKMMLASLALVLFSSIVSLWKAEFLGIGLYYIFVLLWLFLIYLFIINKIRTKESMRGLLVALVASGFFQSLVALGQFLRNGYLGFHFLGEQLIDPEKIGVAKIAINGVNHIRSYGTFSHPNTLAFFLVITGFVALHLFLEAKRKRSRTILVVVFTAIAVALLLTFSRIGWLTGFGLWSIFLARYWWKNKQQSFQEITKYFFGAIVALVLAVILVGPMIVNRVNPALATTWESWETRNIVIVKSITLVTSPSSLLEINLGNLSLHPFIGVGIGNFMINIIFPLTGYPLWMAEPAHNTFLMVLVEIGFLGLLGFLALCFYIWKVAKDAPSFLQYCLATLFITMFFDHGFWDVRQAQILMIILFGVAATFSRKLTNL